MRATFICLSASHFSRAYRLPWRSLTWMEAQRDVDFPFHFVSGSRPSISIGYDEGIERVSTLRFKKLARFFIALLTRTEKERRAKGPGSKYLHGRLISVDSVCSNRVRELFPSQRSVCDRFAIGALKPRLRMKRVDPLTVHQPLRLLQVLTVH